MANFIPDTVYKDYTFFLQLSFYHGSETNRGKKCILYKGYSYRIEYESKDGGTISCILPYNSNHNHDPSEQNNERKILRTQV